MNGLIKAISSLFNGKIRLATFVMSLFPLVELKGGIIYAWGGGLNFVESFLFAYLGSTIVFIVVFFLLKPVLGLLKKWKLFNSLAVKVENYFQGKAEETEKKQSEKKIKLNAVRLKQLGVFIFVAIPLPMTGIWAGTGLAVFLNLKFKQVVLPIAVGNLVAGLLVSGISAVCKLIGVDLNYVLWGLLIIAVILFTLTLIKIARQKEKNGDKE